VREVPGILAVHRRTNTCKNFISSLSTKRTVESLKQKNPNTKSNRPLTERATSSNWVHLIVLFVGGTIWKQEQPHTSCVSVALAELKISSLS
jgi:hypothetical protein